MPFSNAALYPGTRKKRMLDKCLLQPVFAKSGSFAPERFGDISPVLSGERLCVVWLILSVPRKYFIL